MSSSRRRAPVLVPLFLVFIAAAGMAAQKLTPEEIVRRHAEALAAPAAEPGRDVQGTCRASSLMGAGTVDGAFGLKSTIDTSRFDLRFGIPTYEGESIVFDGKTVDVGFAQRRSNARSALGSFLSTYSQIVSDGLLGGALNRRWPVRDLEARGAKQLSSDGLKKLDGRELHRLRYRVGRNQGDLTVHLYFEPDTYRHVATVYAASRSQNATDLDPTAMQSDERFTLTEKFSNFETTPAGAVPKEWFAHFSRTGARTIEWKYECRVQSVASSVP